jgi:hypothetical protein
VIIEGAPAGSVGFWSKHLQRTDTNESVVVHETRGTIADDLDGALREMQAVASGSRSRGNFMYQANINPYEHEHLTPEQWKQAVDTLEKNLGLEGHQRVVVEHVKDGRQHYHVIWNRVDVDTMRVRDVGGNFFTHERTARQLEKEFGLEPAPRTHGDREGPRTSKRTDLWEYNRGQETGLSPKAMKAEVTGLWRAADSGQAFVAALEERGYILVKGDRRDFCIIDRAGDEHSLSRRLDGVTPKEIRERLAGIDRDALPSVMEGKAQQCSRELNSHAPPPNMYDQNEIRRQSELERQQMLADRPPVNLYDQSEARRQSQIEREQMRADRAAPDTRQDFRYAKTENFEPAQGKEAPSTSKTAADVAGASLGVVNVATGGVEKLTDFVADFLTGGSPPPKRDPAAERVDQILAQRRAASALENIRDTIDRGKNLRPEDVQNLTQHHLQNIRSKGDDYLLDLIRRMEHDRERDNSRERERER